MTTKKTLRTHGAPPKPAPTIAPADIVSLRDRLRLSRGLFARYLRTNPRTLEAWEQGRAKPNQQATLLLHLVARFPDTVARLAEL
jgi:putative transcriptional regulator